MGGSARAAREERSKHWLIWPALALAVTGTLAVGALFAWPDGDSEPESFTLEHVDEYQVGSVTFNPDGDFYVVRLGQNNFVALSAQDSHVRHCTVMWRPDFEFPDPETDEEQLGWFRDPCSGSTYDKAGNRVFGPAPCDLAQLPVRIVNEKVVVENVRTECVRTARNGS